LFSEKTNKKLIAFLNGCPKSFHRLDECRFADFVYQSILDYCRVDDFNKDKFKEYINNVYNFTDKEIDVWLDIYKRIEYLIDNIMYTLPNYGEIIVKIYNIEERY
jgi:hypothetical protein